MKVHTDHDKWPKTLAPLTPEDEAVFDDFVKVWHEVLPGWSYRAIERFNHSFPVRYSRPSFRRTIEVGAGLGEHLRSERLSEEQERDYVAVELRENMAERIFARFPRISVIVGDCQASLPFPDEHFDRYIAVHVLEHLPNLPACIREAWRLLDKQRGQALFVIPCDPGLAYSLARRVSAQRLFERRYHRPYAPFIAREHINRPEEIFAELMPYFVVERRCFFPLRFLPIRSLNLCIGLALRPRPAPLAFEQAIDSPQRLLSALDNVPVAAMPAGGPSAATPRRP
jgi:SAM-dependent methyltransferase